MLSVACFAILLTNCNLKTAEEYYRIGTWYDTLGNYKKSFKAYSKAIKKNPNNPLYYVRRANSRAFGSLLKKSHELIIEDYNKAIRIEMYNPFAIYSRAFYYYNVKANYIMALRDLDTLLSKNPKHVDGYFLRGQMYYDKKDTVKGNYNFINAVEYSIDKKETLGEIASFQKTNGYYNEALLNFNRSLRLSDKVKFNYYRPMAMCYWKIGQKDSACYYYQLISNKSNLLGEYAELRNFCER